MQIVGNFSREKAGSKTKKVSDMLKTAAVKIRRGTIFTAKTSESNTSDTIKTTENVNSSLTCVATPDKLVNENIIMTPNSIEKVNEVDKIEAIPFTENINLFDETPHKVLKSGKLSKRGKKGGRWQIREFVLTLNELNYYDTDESRTWRGMIDITRDTTIEILNPNECDKKNNAFVILNSSRDLYLHGLTNTDRDEWILEVEKLIMHLGPREGNPKAKSKRFSGLFQSNTVKPIIKTNSTDDNTNQSSTSDKPITEIQTAQQMLNDDQDESNRDESPVETTETETEPPQQSENRHSSRLSSLTSFSSYSTTNTATKPNVIKTKRSSLLAIKSVFSSNKANNNDNDNSVVSMEKWYQFLGPNEAIRLCILVGKKNAVGIERPRYE